MESEPGPRRVDPPVRSDPDTAERPPGPLSKIPGLPAPPLEPRGRLASLIRNAIAALLVHLRDDTGKISEGDTAPVTREVLRRTIKNPLERPRIHVG